MEHIFKLVAGLRCFMNFAKFLRTPVFKNHIHSDSVAQ